MGWWNFIVMNVLKFFGLLMICRLLRGRIVFVFVFFI